MANLKEMSGSMRSPDKNMSPESTINVRIINSGSDNTFSYGSGGEPVVKFGEHFTGYFKDSSECSNQTDVSYGQIPTRQISTKGTHFEANLMQIRPTKWQNSKIHPNMYRTTIIG